MTAPRSLTLSDLKNLVSAPPAPLFSLKHRLGLLFSAKSGCTYGVKWFFDQMGFLEAALHYDRWIHNYREQVFYKSTTYKKDLTRIVDETTRTLRLVREPYSRCVSSFIHAVKFGYDDGRLTSFLRRPVNRESGLSFAEWVAFLESENLRDCNVHHRLQAHELELEGLVLPTRVIRLEDGSDGFREIEQEWGLRASDLDSHRSSVHHTRRTTDASSCADRKFTLHPQDRTEIPPARAFYNAGLRARVGKLYHDDFQRYGYDIDAEL